MQPSRPLAAVIVAAALAAAAPSAALAQDGQGALPNLTPTPRTPAPAPKTPTQRTVGSTHASALPSTGADARVLALVGLSLLLTGAGLRMRTAVERF